MGLVKEALTQERLNRNEEMDATDEVRKKTVERYNEIFRLLVGKEWQLLIGCKSLIACTKIVSHGACRIAEKVKK